ncbi:MAG: response regulator [Chitinophagales bacterium]
MKSVHILLVEDNEGDIFLTTEAFGESKFKYKISIARNGKEAIDFVFQKGNFKKALTPDLILLDINLPVKNGLEVLHVLKNDASVKQIPIIILTTSSSKNDINLSYKENANCYITKPVDADDLEKVVNSIEDFWMKTARLPLK